ncbi:nicotinate-nucleotide adenylyltransferase [Aliiruegeria sabulilitoris]|uniref:nicotinate-nucleotide adenylyltransferase n=1 Tax=Aliiruegeria sabulilitoris TaxID=1510458 RepID=UPI0008295B18|nr:nicotinate-nucleotide adenylyltransferase [Aliiruegeria sabulilitoris]NDR58427.1 nicotinate-nucleotide adenylyltransferase [Pseudoruegeria sp. M32A2M]
MRDTLPHVGPGQVVGLLGGSFDPPHMGHVHITREGLKRFGLDQVWWLVSPGNPLKAHGPAPLERRMAAAKQVMQHPRVIVTDIEAQIGTRYTAETLEELIRLYPRNRFVWLMGADNLAQFHRWERWEWIMANVRIGILARPGGRVEALNAPAARYGRAWRLPAEQAGLLARSVVPAWCFVNVPMKAISSSEIRARGDWG